MQDKKIIQVGDPRLRIKSEPINNDLFGSADLLSLAELLVILMKQNNGIGLAAPQLGINKRIFSLGMDKNEKRPNESAIPFAVLINPEFSPLSDTLIEDYEACLSVGNGLMAKVPRFEKIGFRAFDPEGNCIEQEICGLHARIIQHELDHLNGILFLDQVKDPKTYGFYNELKEANSINRELI